MTAYVKRVLPPGAENMINQGTDVLSREHDRLWMSFFNTLTHGEAESMNLVYLHGLYPDLTTPASIYQRVNNKIRFATGEKAQVDVQRFFIRVSKCTSAAQPLPSERGWGLRKYNIDVPITFDGIKHIEIAARDLRDFFIYLELLPIRLKSNRWNVADLQAVQDPGYHRLMVELAEFARANPAHGKEPA